MATSEQITALLKSFRDGDNARFYATAMQMAAHSARAGHVHLAKEIRDLVDASKLNDTHRAKSDDVTAPELAGLLSVCNSQLRIGDMVLDSVVREKLVRVVLEHRQQHRFEEFGLRPRKKLLLVGPSGTGKTMTASVLAGELGLPLYTILLDGLITKFLGETAAKLRLVFDAISKHRGVYFFDEFDALGAHRATHNDVGEIRRVLNSFLQFIEQVQSESLVLAATNHIELLDQALFRRFDDVVEYSVPKDDLILETFKNRLSLFDHHRIDWMKIVEAAHGLSYADLVKSAEEAAKDSILHDEPTLTTEGMVRAVLERKVMRN